MPAMATVETMARSQNELLEAGRAKLAKFQSRNKGKKTGKKAASVADAKIYGNGNPKVETSPQVSSDAHSDAVKGNVDRNGVDVDQPREILFEPDVNRSERLVEEDRRHFVAAELSARVENDEEERRKQREAEELRGKELEAEEAIRREREAEEQRNQQALMERLKRIEQEAEENRQRQREAEEAKRKERERLDAEEARKQALIAERKADEARRKEAEEAKRKEAEEAKRKERESEQRRQRIIAEITRKKQLEEEEIKRKEREAEEIRRKEREAEESQRRQRDEDEFRKKQREEFASLEQHIQDLTEEKFGLQRELAKARAMSENFVQEHSALVENYNNQVLPLFVMI